MARTNIRVSRSFRLNRLTSLIDLSLTDLFRSGAVKQKPDLPDACLRDPPGRPRFERIVLLDAGVPPNDSTDATSLRIKRCILRWPTTRTTQQCQTKYDLIGTQY
jgi:hypothetical protein